MPLLLLLFVASDETNDSARSLIKVFKTVKSFSKKRNVQINLGGVGGVGASMLQNTVKTHHTGKRRLNRS